MRITSRQLRSIIREALLRESGQVDEFLKTNLYNTWWIISRENTLEVPYNPGKDLKTISYHKEKSIKQAQIDGVTINNRYIEDFQRTMDYTAFRNKAYSLIPEMKSIYQKQSFEAYGETHLDPNTIKMIIKMCIPLLDDYIDVVIQKSAYVFFTVDDVQITSKWKGLDDLQRQLNQMLNKQKDVNVDVILEAVRGTFLRSTYPLASLIKSTIGPHN